MSQGKYEVEEIAMKIEKCCFTDAASFGESFCMDFPLNILVSSTRERIGETAKDTRKINNTRMLDKQRNKTRLLVFQFINFN